MSCPIKSNSNKIELTVQTSCYWVSVLEDCEKNLVQGTSEYNINDILIVLETNGSNGESLIWEDMIGGNISAGKLNFFSEAATYSLSFIIFLREHS